MATIAAIEIGTEAAEAVAPEAEAVGSKILTGAEKVGKEVGKEALTEAERVGPGIAKKAEGLGSKIRGLLDKPELKSTVTRLSDVGTGVMIGQSLGKSKPENEDEQAPRHSIASYIVPTQTTTGSGERHVTFDTRFGGAPATIVIRRQPQNFAACLQIAVLILLIIVIIITFLSSAHKKVKTNANFWYGVALGGLGGAAYWYWKRRA